MMLNDKDFYKEIFENIPEGIIVSDELFSIIAVNKYILELTNYTHENFHEKPITDFIINHKDCSICSGKRDCYLESEHLTHTADFVDKNGKNIPVRMNHKKFKKYYISTITPLSELSFLNQAHIDFVSTVSHELRTPLTSIKGFADTLLTAGDKLDKEQQSRFISIIKSQIDRLTRLVENLLTVTKLESKKDRSIYKAVNFKDFTKEILYKITPKTADNIIKIEIIPELPKIWVDSDKLEQIIINLLDNAMKYSDKGSTITIKGGFLSDNPDYAEIKVQDQGIGIPKDSLSKIFTKFSRIDNPLTRNVQGTGLGLYITKTLVEGMGGKIWADSDGNGSTFTLLLPVATPEKQAGQKFLNEDKL